MNMIDWSEVIMEYIYDKLKINYDIKGMGPPLILLHGWGTNLHTFDYVSKYLEKNFTIYMIDLPGFGQSEEPRYPYNLSNYVHFLCTFINELQINNPIILGHSFGGRIAIKYASISKNLDRLILVDSAGIKKRRTFKQQLSIWKYKYLKYYYRKTKNITKYNQLTSSSGSSDYIACSAIMKGTLSKVIKEDLRKCLSKIEVETLIIWGRDDEQTPYSDALYMHKKIKDSGLVTFDDVGHFPYLERKNYFKLVLKKYLGVDN